MTININIHNVNQAILDQFYSIDTETIVKAAIIQAFPEDQLKPNSFVHPIVRINPNDGHGEYKFYATYINTDNGMTTYNVWYGREAIHVDKKVW